MGMHTHTLTHTLYAPTLSLATNTEGEYEYAPEDGNYEAGAGEGAAEGDYGLSLIHI